MIHLKCFFSRVYFFFLYLFFNFEGWHYKSSYYCSAYKRNIVKLINKHIDISDSIVEIGCGLGEIISRINCQNKFGIDRCFKVIDAAIFIYRFKKIKFISGSFHNLNINLDHIILINFTHELTKIDLVKMINAIILKFSPKTIFLDSYHEDYFTHLRHHNYSMIFEKNFINYKLTEKILSDDGKRYLYVFKKTN